MHNENEKFHKKEMDNPIWVVVIIILLIINIIFVSWAAYILSHLASRDLSPLFIMFLSLPLVFVNFIAAFFYIRTHHSQGKSKIISYIIFIALSFMFSYLAWAIISFRITGIIDRSSELYPFLLNPVIDTMIAIVSTILNVIFLRLKYRK